MEFVIVGVEQENMYKWLDEHNRVCPFTGEKFTYSFTPTGLGMMIKVKCLCGEEKDVTVYDEW
jgi:hypothetical protein